MHGWLPVFRSRQFILWVVRLCSMCIPFARIIQHTRHRAPCGSCAAARSSAYDFNGVGVGGCSLALVRTPSPSSITELSTSKHLSLTTADTLDVTVCSDPGPTCASSTPRKMELLAAILCPTSEDTWVSLASLASSARFGATTVRSHPCRTKFAPRSLVECTTPRRPWGPPDGFCLCGAKTIVKHDVLTM